MKSAGNFGAWQDRVAPGDEPLSGASDWRAASFHEAMSFVRLAVECAVQPVIALVEELPELLHFEMHARCDRAPRNGR